jgi:hypothetical protein
MRSVKAGQLAALEQQYMWAEIHEIRSVLSPFFQCCGCGAGSVCFLQCSGSESDPTDPNPDPPDTCVFCPPGSGSFYHHAKIIRKILNPTICDPF